MVAKKKIVFLMLLTFLLIFVEPFLGYAANNSISAGSSKTADIDTAGNLKFSVKAVGASSGTRWKTVGLYVTSDPTGRNGKEGTKAKDCVFFDKLPKGCSKKMKQIEPEWSQLLLPSPKTSLTTCVTKPV